MKSMHDQATVLPIPQSAFRNPQCARLLVSVRNMTEARAAFLGGADIIDVKEPDRGPLGRADSNTIEEILADPLLFEKVTMALGELQEYEHAPTDWQIPAGLLLAKVGLARQRFRTDWRNHFGRFSSRLQTIVPLVPVAYADSKRADAPEVQSVLELAIEQKSRYLLIDTHTKDGHGLLEWLPLASLIRIAEQCTQHRIGLAVAGSLTEKSFPQVIACHPSVIAVRGAACTGGERSEHIDPLRVRRLKQQLLTLQPRIA